MTTQPRPVQSAFADQDYRGHLLETRKWTGEADAAKPYHVCIFRSDGRWAGRTAGFATLEKAMASARRKVDTGRLRSNPKGINP